MPNVKIRHQLGRPARLNVWLADVKPPGKMDGPVSGPLYPEDVVEVPDEFLDEFPDLFEGYKACLEITREKANRPLIFPDKFTREQHRKYRLAQRVESTRKHIKGMVGDRDAMESLVQPDLARMRAMAQPGAGRFISSDRYGLDRDSGAEREFRSMSRPE